MFLLSWDRLHPVCHPPHGVPAVSLPGSPTVGEQDGSMAIDLACPGCGTQMYAEQAHNRCPRCLYYEPCCDGAPQPSCRTADSADASASGRRVDTSQ